MGGVERDKQAGGSLSVLIAAWEGADFLLRAWGKCRADLHAITHFSLHMNTFH